MAEFFVLQAIVAHTGSEKNLIAGFDCIYADDYISLPSLNTTASRKLESSYCSVNKLWDTKNSTQHKPHSK